MIRASSLIASLAIAGLVCLSPLEGQSLSEKANLQIEQLRYDGPHVNPSDYNTMSLYVRAAVVYGGIDEIINEGSRLIAGCWMNTEAASAETPGKDWSDWGASCFNNDWVYSPDFPRQCGEHLIDVKLKETKQLGCQNGAPAMPRCFQSTKPNRFIGWASGGAWHLTDGLTYNDVNIRQALPPGEMPCKRHFLLRGTVEGLEVGDWLEFQADVPDPATGAIVPWEAKITPSTGISLPKAPQIADGASYSAKIVSGPDKKSCTFKRNGAATIQATFTGVDDRGRTSGGLDLTDLSIACVCNDGAESCPPDRVLNVEATGIEEGESASVGVTIQHPAGGQAVSEAFPIPGSGIWTVVSNLTEGASYTVTFNSFTLSARPAPCRTAPGRFLPRERWCN